MPQVETKYFGTMHYQPESVYDFPYGLPAFEQERRFVLIEIPDDAPLVFLQSLAEPLLCFLALPVVSVDPDYHLDVSIDDRAVLDLEASAAAGDGILALALVSGHDGFSPTVNLMAPVVINLPARRAVQAIRMDRKYSHQHPLPSAGLEPAREALC